MSALGARRERVLALLAEREGPDTAAKICGLCVQLAGVSGAGMTVMSAAGARGLVHATDPTARYLDDVQLTVGQGPCTEAFASRAPVLVGDLNAPDQQHRWPQFVDLAAPVGVVAVFSFPLQVGAAWLGTLDLYRASAGSLSSQQLTDALVCADLATQTLLANATGPGGPVGLASLDQVDMHPVVFQATGMVMVQLGVDAAEALLRLRAHAYATGALVTEAAGQVTEHGLRLEAETP